MASGKARRLPIAEGLEAMPYPQPTPDDVAFFETHGWIAIDDAVDPADLELLAERCEVILEKKHVMAFDWAWEKGQPRGARLQEDREARVTQINSEVGRRYKPVDAIAAQ